MLLILSLLGVGAILYTRIGLLGNFLGARLGVLIINNIRRSLFEHIQSLSMEFFGQRSAGDIVNCLIVDTQKVENSLVTMGLSVIIIEICNILFSAIFLFSLNWQLAVNTARLRDNGEARNPVCNADILTGQANYIQAAVRGRVAGIDLAVNNQGQAEKWKEFNINLLADSAWHNESKMIMY